MYFNLIQRTVKSKPLVLTFVMALMILCPILAHYQAIAASAIDPNKVSDILLRLNAKEQLIDRDTIDGRFDFTPSYRVTGTGEVEINCPYFRKVLKDNRIWMDYKVHPDGRVIISRLRIDIQNFTHREGRSSRRRYEFFCNKVFNQGEIEARVDWGNLTIDEGEARVIALTHDDCNGSCSFPCQPYQCGSLPIVFDEVNPAPIEGIHRPALNEFSLQGAFTHMIDSEAWDVNFEFFGTFVNRPPVAAIRAEGEGLISDKPGEWAGCPPVTWVHTDSFSLPFTQANDPAGLLLTRLRSASTDWDCLVGRADLVSENWYRARDKRPYEFIGRGIELDLQTFEFGILHELVLTATDRDNVHSVDRCQFIVADWEPPEVQPPPSLFIFDSEKDGETVSTSPDLHKFLAGSTAIDNSDPEPVPLPPQIGAVDVTETTLFPFGTTTVTFRFTDRYGNIGSATSDVTLGALEVIGNPVGMKSYGDKSKTIKNHFVSTLVIDHAK
jgi:hypothetical protein